MCGVADSARRSGPEPLSPDELLVAIAQNHRAWFRRGARVTGGDVERIGGIELVVDGGHGMIPFARRRERTRTNLDQVMQRIRYLNLRSVGCWSLRGDPRWGAFLVARGFVWGWEPHWMALDLNRLRDDASEHVVSAVHAPYAEGVPYIPTGDELGSALHVGVWADGFTVGHIAVNPWRGVAGIYSMGVAPAYRGRGIGQAMTIGACRIAAEKGCRYAVLNATEAGERVYRKTGFDSLGWGQTWWFFRGPVPSDRQTALAEAIGNGELRALTALAPSDREVGSPLPGGTSPLRLAVLTGQLEAARWLLDRVPDLAGSRFEETGGTLLHLAVEHNRPDFAELALSRGVDPNVRDRIWNGTALGWAQHFQNAAIAEVLAPCTDADNPE
jgi:ribosomal protein S18 acetylase RimI-like enzyme